MLKNEILFDVADDRRCHTNMPGSQVHVKGKQYSGDGEVWYILFHLVLLYMQALHFDNLKQTVTVQT